VHQVVGVYLKEYIGILLDHAYHLLYKKQFGVNHAEHIFVELIRITKRVWGKGFRVGGALPER